MSDIQCPDEMNMVIESKSRNKKGFQWHKLIRESGCPEMDSWIQQVTEDANGMFYLLCFKIDYEGWYVAVSDKYDWKHPGNYIAYKSHLIIPLQKFLEDNRDKIISLVIP